MDRSEGRITSCPLKIERPSALTKGVERGYGKTELVRRQFTSSKHAGDRLCISLHAPLHTGLVYALCAHWSYDITFHILSPHLIVERTRKRIRAVRRRKRQNDLLFILFHETLACPLFNRYLCTG